MRQAKKRYGLCILDYIVTSNHIHLLVKNTDKDVIPRSMQLIAGRTAQEYNLRKKRKGAYWEDRYFATAIDTDEYLARCLAYIAMNMVRAGVVIHPREWKHSGYREIQSPPKRYCIIDRESLASLLGLKGVTRLPGYHHQWIEEALNGMGHKRQSIWSEGVAVGSQHYVESVMAQLEVKAAGRSVYHDHEARLYQVKESEYSYQLYFDGKMGVLNENKGSS